MRVFRNVVLAATVVAALGCSTEPHAYSIAGTWEGSSVGQGLLHLELAHFGDKVTGTLRLTNSGAQTIDLIIEGTLRDSSLSVFSGSAHLSAIYRIQESNAGQFFAQFAQGTAPFDGTVTRK